MISMEEFFEGISKMDGPAQAADLFRNTKLNELLVKLVLQQNQELQEDLQELLRHTPGAALRLRPDSLRRRACRTPAKDLFMDYISDKATSPVRSRVISSPCVARSARLSAEKSFGLVDPSLAGADSLAPLCCAANNELLARLTSAVEGCGDRLSSLVAEVADLRSNDAAMPICSDSDSPDQPLPPIAPKLPAAPPALADSGQSHPRSAWRLASSSKTRRRVVESEVQARSASRGLALSTAAVAWEGPDAGSPDIILQLAPPSSGPI